MDGGKKFFAGDCAGAAYEKAIIDHHNHHRLWRSSRERKCGVLERESEVMDGRKKFFAGGDCTGGACGKTIIDHHHHHHHHRLWSNRERNCGVLERESEAMDGGKKFFAGGDCTGGACEKTIIDHHHRLWRSSERKSGVLERESEVMDGGKKFFAGDFTGGACEKTIIDRIMLKYRPIAPKPIAGVSSTGEPSKEETKPVFTGGRGKRKYVRIRKKRCTKTAKPRVTVATLQLLPENEPPPAIGSGSRRDADLTVQIEDPHSDRKSGGSVESLVTVECVTDRYADGGGLGSTDVERMRNLEMDTCPGFVSDGWNRVRWVNQAYRRMMMVGGPQVEGDSPPAVRLVVKEELPAVWPAFACRVRVEDRWQEQKNTRTVPCDVWRMDFVGHAFAWRLDIGSALSLGR